MNCVACQEHLCQSLQGAASDRSGVDRHLQDCANCRAYQETTERLRTGLTLLRPPAPPVNLTARLVAAVQEDLHRSRRSARLRFAIGFAVAASVVIAAAVRLWPGRPASQPHGPETLVKQTDPQPPAPERVTPRQSMETAVGAMASLTARTTTETFAETKKLMPLVEPALPELSWEPALPSLSLGDAGRSVSEGLEPVAMHAKRAVGLLRRDLLNQD